MTRLIDADALRENMGLDKVSTDGKVRDYDCRTLMLYEIEDYIYNAPTIDAEPVVRCKDCEMVLEALPSADRPQGEWILSDLQSQADNDNGNYTYVCTNCNHTDIHAKAQKVPYCWWCGARMKRG